MANKAQKSKFFRVATEGATTDGRKIEKIHLQQMAKSYDPKKYGARIFMEHVRGLNPAWGFSAMGDVIAVRNGEVEIDGKTLVTLEAQIEPTAEFVALTKARQKIYSSIEIQPDFAGSGDAYLIGLGVTDSPASLATEMLQFAAQNPSASPFAARKQHKDNLFSEAVEIELEFEDAEDGGPSLVDRITALFKSKRDNDAARFTDVHSAVEQVAGVAGDAQLAADNAAADCAALRQEFSDYRAAADQRLQEFSQRLDTTPAPPAPRDPATGTTVGIQTDC